MRPPSPSRHKTKKVTAIESKTLRLDREDSHDVLSGIDYEGRHPTSSHSNYRA
jgi:hypothetical protein